MPRVSIDVGITERFPDLVVIPAWFPWTDVGNWWAVHEVPSARAQTPDIIRGMCCSRESGGNIVVAPKGKIIALCGIERCAVIDTPDVLLICPLDRAHEVKEIVAEMERRGLGEHL